MLATFPRVVLPSYYDALAILPIRISCSDTFAFASVQDLQWISLYHQYSLVWLPRLLYTAMPKTQPRPTSIEGHLRALRTMTLSKQISRSGTTSSIRYKSPCKTIMPYSSAHDSECMGITELNLPQNGVTYTGTLVCKAVQPHNHLWGFQSNTSHPQRRKSSTSQRQLLKLRSSAPSTALFRQPALVRPPTTLFLVS